VQRHHSKLLPRGADDSHLARAYLMIDPRFSSDKTPPSIFDAPIFMLLRALVQPRNADVP
jgi:hypothetical protein